MAKKIRTENLKSDPGSKFLEYAHCNHHFVISLQKIAVFDEKLYFCSLTHKNKFKICQNLMKICENMTKFNEHLTKYDDI